MSRIVVIEEDTLMRELLMEWLRGRLFGTRGRTGRIRIAGGSRDCRCFTSRAMRERRGCGPSRRRTRRCCDRHLGAISPGTRRILHRGRDLGVRRVIAKPFSQTELLAAVDGVIGPAR